MSDQTINQFVAQFADAAARVAFVPDPPTPAADGDNGYFAFQQDDGSIWCWDSALVDWVQVGNGSGANTVSAAGTLTVNQIVLGAGSKAVAALGSLGTTTTVLHGNAAGAPTFGAVALATDVSGDLPFANLAQGSALSVLGVAGNSTADVASIAAGTDGFVLRRSGTAVAFGTLASGAFPSTMYVPQVSVTQLTDAQIKALPTTPVTLIASPGSGFRIKLLAPPTLHLVNASGVYANVNTAYSTLQITWASGAFAANPIANDDSLTTDLTDLTTFLNTISAGLGWIIEMGIPNLQAYDAGSASGASEWVSNWFGSVQQDGGVQGDNKGLVIAADNNAAGVYTGGHASNTLKVTVYYTVETL